LLDADTETGRWLSGRARIPEAPARTHARWVTLAGARGHTLIYRTHAGVLVAETHEVDAGRIVRADTFYETNPAARSQA
jgi:hypothetical protein